MEKLSPKESVNSADNMPRGSVRGAEENSKGPLTLSLSTASVPEALSGADIYNTLSKGFLTVAQTSHFMKFTGK